MRVQILTMSGYCGNAHCETERKELLEAVRFLQQRISGLEAQLALALTQLKRLEQQADLAYEALMVQRSAHPELEHESSSE